MTPPAFGPARLIAAHIRRLSHGTVVSGPFRGMRYNLEVVLGSVLMPKILGAYERELHPIIEDACTRQPEIVINIGAGEGYYAVGLATRLRQSRIIAFEENDFSRNSLMGLANVNGVADRIELLARCEPGDLRNVVPATGAFVLCDIEGNEETVLNPDAAPGLRNSEILVEIHDFVTRGLGDVIRARFDATHNVGVVWQEDRHLSDFPRPAWFQKLLPEAYSLAFLHEGRPERMYWLHMRPRES